MCHADIFCTARLPLLSRYIETSSSKLVAPYIGLMYRNIEIKRAPNSIVLCDSLP
jgi:hypothetical protein